MALTLRITEEESTELEKIGNLYEVGTASGTIKKMISHHLKIANDLKTSKYLIKEMKEEKEKIAGLINKKQNAKKTVSNCNSQLAKWANKNKGLPF